MSFLNVDKQNSAQTPTICNLDTVIKLHIKIVRKKKHTYFKHFYKYNTCFVLCV